MVATEEDPKVQTITEKIEIPEKTETIIDLQDRPENPEITTEPPEMTEETIEETTEETTEEMTEEMIEEMTEGITEMSEEMIETTTEGSQEETTTETTTEEALKRTETMIDLPEDTSKRELRGLP